MTGHERKEVTGSLQYCAINKSPSGKASMTGHEGKEVTGSLQYCAINKSPCRKASMTGRDVRWPKFVGTGTERNAFPFKKDLSLSSFFSFSLFLKTGLSTLSNLSLD